MLKQQKLTPAEWEIMESVWQLGKSTTARDVHQYAYPNGEKAFTTVQTILNTLNKKGFLKCEKIGMVNFYSPEMNKQTAKKEHLLSTAKQLFNGSVPDMANFLIDASNLSMDDIKIIKIFVEAKEKELNSVCPKRT